MTARDSVSFAEAARLLRVHRGTITRWAQDGLKGVHLQFERYGVSRRGSRCYTSRKALREFARRCRHQPGRTISDEVAARAENLLPS